MAGASKVLTGNEPIAHRHVAVLKVADPKVLDEVRAILPLDQYVIGVVSPTELIIDPSRLGQLASALAERGMAPLMKRARGQGKEAPPPRAEHRDIPEVDDEPTLALRPRRTD
jgi:hypothetical protein